MAEPAYTKILPHPEDGHAWPAQGEWTYEDCQRLPEDGQRYEVIRGHLYVSPPPIYDHQYVVGQLYWHLSGFVRQGDLGVVLMAPFDVLLPKRIASPVEPDLLFIRTENLPRKGDKYFAGVPDLVVEVLSPSTRRVDTRIKLEAYRDAGVPEYWVVDPKAETVVIYSLSGDGKSYVELCRGAVGDIVGSAVLPGLRVPAAGLFPPQ